MRGDAVRAAGQRQKYCRNGRSARVLIIKLQRDSGMASVQSGRLQWQAALTEEAEGVAHDRELQGPPAADAVAQVSPYEITREHKKILRAYDAADPYLLHLFVPCTDLLHEKGKRRQDDSEPKKVGKNAQQGRPVAPCLVHGSRRREGKGAEFVGLLVIGRKMRHRYTQMSVFLELRSKSCRLFPFISPKKQHMLAQKKYFRQVFFSLDGWCAMRQNRDVPILGSFLAALTTPR